MAGPGHTHTARPTPAKPPGQAPQAAPVGEVVRFPAARIGVHLREAIRKVNNGEYGDAVTEARKAIDAMDGKVPDRQAERQIAAIRKQERTLGQRLGRLRHGQPVRDRGLPGRGAGDGLEARRRAGALPGDGFPGGSGRRSHQPGTTRADSP